MKVLCAKFTRRPVNSSDRRREHLFPTVARLDGARAKIFIAGIIGGAKPMAPMEMDGMATLALPWVSRWIWWIY